MDIGYHVEISSIQIKFRSVDVISNVERFFKTGHPVIAHQYDVYVRQVVLGNLVHEIAQHTVSPCDLFQTNTKRTVNR